jgi:hypothetical protein
MARLLALFAQRNFDDAHKDFRLAQWTVIVRF